MSRHILTSLVALSVVLGSVACDGSTLSSTKNASNETAPKTRRASLQQEPSDSAAKRAKKSHDHKFQHIAFSEVPEKKVEPELSLSEEKWRERLGDDAYTVLRESGTEAAFSGDLLRNKKQGVYVCGGCGKPLFSSETKFKSGTGWPSFYDAVEDGTVGLVKDRSYGSERVEVYCTHCGGHLGHVFNDGPAPTGLRYCINSDALDFEPAGSAEVATEK